MARGDRCIEILLCLLRVPLCELYLSTGAGHVWDHLVLSIVLHCITGMSSEGWEGLKYYPPVGMYLTKPWICFKLSSAEQGEPTGHPA